MSVAQTVDARRLVGTESVLYYLLWQGPTGTKRYALRITGEGITGVVPPRGALAPPPQKDRLPDSVATLECFRDGTTRLLVAQPERTGYGRRETPVRDAQGQGQADEVLTEAQVKALMGVGVPR